MSHGVNGKSWYTPLRHIFFRYQILFWNTEVLLYGVFPYCGPTNSRPKIVILPTSLLSVTISDTGNFLKHWRVPLRKVSILWDKNFQQKIVMSPSYTYTFSIPEISGILKKNICVRWVGGVRRFLCISTGYREPNGTESRGGASTLAESSRVT